MEIDLDNPASSEPGALDTNSAASLIGNLIDPPEVKAPAAEKVQEPAEPAAEPEVTAEAETTEPETEATEDDPTVTIKIDGKDVEVKLSELKNGYQRQADYTRKTMEVAEQRKAAEAEKSKALQERQAYAENLQRMQIQLEGALQEQQKTDWERLLNESPQEYLKQMHLAQQRQAALQENYAKQREVSEQLRAEQEQSRQAYLREQQEELLAKLPDWKDEAKSKAERTALREYLVKEGFSPEAVDSVSEAKAVLVARKAMLYDQLMSKAQAAAKKVSTLPTKVERPGAGEAPGLDKRSSAFQKLSKSGRVEDAAAVFANLI